MKPSNKLLTANSQEVQDLIDALGIPCKHLTEVVLVIKANDVARIHAKYHPTEDQIQAGKLEPIKKKFVLVERAHLQELESTTARQTRKLNQVKQAMQGIPDVVPPDDTAL